MPVTLDRSCKPDHWCKSTSHRPSIPPCQVPTRILGCLVPEVSKAHPQVVCTDGFQLLFRKVRKDIPLLRLQILRILQPYIARLLEVLHRFLLFPSHGVHRLPRQLHDMEAVEGDLGLRQRGLDPGNECRRHIHADIRDCRRHPSVVDQILTERADRALVLARRGKQHAARIKIHKHADVRMAAGPRGFVDPDTFDCCIRLRCTCICDIRLHDTPQRGIELRHRARDFAHGERFGKRHHHGLKQEREPAAGPCPRNANKVYATVCTSHPRNTGMEITFMLEKVEMAPFLVDRIMHRAPRRLARRAGEARSTHEINPDIELPDLRAEFYLGAVPRLVQAQSQGEEVDRLLVHWRVAPDTWSRHVLESTHDPLDIRSYPHDSAKSQRSSDVRRCSKVDS